MIALRMAAQRAIGHARYRVWIAVFRLRVERDAVIVAFAYLIVICTLALLVALTDTGVLK